MDDPEMKETEDWIPRQYSKGQLYTSELTPETIQEAPDDLAALLTEICEESGLDLQPLEDPYRRYYQLDEVHRKEFAGYCVELDCWHEDLDFLLFEMDTSVRRVYEDRLDLKRLSIIYHTDNFYFRIHAYREKVFKLVNVYLGLDVPDRHPNFNDKVFDELGGRGLEEPKRLLSDLLSDPLLSEAIARRKFFAHRLARRDWGGLVWRSLASDQRIKEQFSNVNESDIVDRITDFERFHLSRLEDFGHICERLARFRDDLVAALKASYR